MVTTQTILSQQDGILVVKATGILDEKTSPIIFAQILKYSHEAPQIVIIDLSEIDGAKTSFLNWLLDVHAYLIKKWGDMVLVKWRLEDVLNATGIIKKIKTFDSLEDSKTYCQKNFQHIIDFILKQKNKGIKDEIDILVWTEEIKFFTDESETVPNVENILLYSLRINASDIHLKAGKCITYRVEGVLVQMTEHAILNEKHLEVIQDALLIHHPKTKIDLQSDHDVDFWYLLSKSNVSFRVNGFRSLWQLGFCLRRIEKKSRSCEELWLPNWINKFIHAKQGLVLITWPTGSGKSTTLVSMLEEINTLRGDSIITIEDPIEFMFTDKKSIFSQREIGRDTNSFPAAIRAAMREDPNIVMIGEMRDSETTEAALNLAETGHLVLSTLHTSGTVQTLSRIVQFFTPNQQRQIYGRIADSLLGVLSQRLLMRRDGSNKRIAIFELMLVNPGIKNLIRSGDMAQMNNAIESGRSEGMIPMYIHAEGLEKRGLLRREDYEWFFTNQDI